MKFYVNNDERAQCQSSISEDTFFIKYQRMLLQLANTKYGRALLCIDDHDAPIVAIGKNYVKYFCGNGQMVYDFRIGAKFANVIRYRWSQFRSYAKYFEVNDWAVSGVSMFSIEPVRMCGASLTAYPDPDPESTSCDGRVRNDPAGGAGSDWASMRSAAVGTSASDSGTEGYIGLQCYSSSPLWNQCDFGVYLFDTSAMVDSDRVDSSIFSYVSDGKVDGLTLSMSLTKATTASNTSLAVGDYDDIVANTTKLASDVAISAITSDSSTYNNVTCNASGIANIIKTGVSKFAMNCSNVADNSEPTWSINAQSGPSVILAETTGTSKDPKLVVQSSTSTTSINYRSFR